MSVAAHSAPAPAAQAPKERRLRMVQMAALDYSFHAHLTPLMEACAEAGFEVVCVGAPGPFVEGLEARGFRYVPVPFARSFDVRRHAACLRALVEVLRRERPDAVHCHTVIAGLLGRIAARWAGVPVSVYTAHGFRFHERMARPAWLFYAGCEWVGGRLSDRIFFLNDADRHAALGLRMIDADRAITVGNGVDLARFSPDAVSAAEANALRDRLGIPAHTKVVTFIGRPTREKGLDTFQAFAEQLIAAREDVAFVAVCPLFEGERHSLLDALKQAAGPRIKVLGWRQDVNALLAMSDVFVLPTLFEGLSTVTIEAMAMALPVVVSDVRGCRELVRDGVTGALLPPGEPRAWAEAIAGLLDDPARCARMGQAARRFVVERLQQREAVTLQVEAVRALVRQRQTHTQEGGPRDGRT